MSAGSPWPLGVVPDEEGANVAVFSAHAQRIELCLFDQAGEHETACLTLPEHTDGVFHGHVPNLRPGQVYGLRAHGTWDPANGHRFNPAKLLLDPYARALQGSFSWQGPNIVDPSDPMALDPRDSAPFVPKAVVTPAPIPYHQGRRPSVPWDESVLYELHVRGMTRLHPEVPQEARGTFQGLAHPRVIEHLQKLGVTAVELLPVAAFLDEHRLVRLGLANYWGYNPYAFMVPEQRYAAADAGLEFRTMVTGLHEAGIEVVLDVVFNHTAESDELGPTLSWRGLDNASYYRLEPADQGLYVNWTGCGNTLDLSHPRVLQLVMDALRHWAAMGVDGFRFDLATVLGRDRAGEFRDDHPLFLAIAQDPVLGGLKMVAEPWDIGPYGYRLGHYPPPFAVWNDRFRDTVRRFWRGDEAMLPELAARLLGSADLLERKARPPQASLNYVTAHDGFTLRDLVSYAHKHNEANKEGNHDGHGDERSANHGVEGPSGEPTIEASRARQQRNLLATLLLAQGVPMLLMGDELGRSQQGNNNAYCQDNALSWLDWAALASTGEALVAFTARLIALRRTLPALRRRRFLHGRHHDPRGVPDVAWLRPDGSLREAPDWHDPADQAMGLLLGGWLREPSPGLSDVGYFLERDLLLLINGQRNSRAFTLPSLPEVRGWVSLLDSAVPDAVPRSFQCASLQALEGQSLHLLQAVPSRSALTRN